MVRRADERVMQRGLNFAFGSPLSFHPSECVLTREGGTESSKRFSMKGIGH